MNHRITTPLLLLALAAGSPALADEQTPPVDGSAGQVVRLTPEQVAALRASGTEAKASAAQGELSGGGIFHQIHGEMGLMVGTNGARGIYGAAEIPLGDNAAAAVSFESTRYGRR